MRTSKSLLKILLIAFVGITFFASVGFADALIRVNAGGGDYADGSGNLWSADYGYNTGSLDSTDSPIAGTSDDPLYQVGRWDPGASPELEYGFDVTNGDYIVNLHFADIWPGTFGVGLRLFDIQIEGVVVENDLDIYAEVGANTALVKTYNVTVADGQLNIRFLHVKENTKINAIEVISAVTDTDPPVWDGLTTGIGLATDTTTGGSVTLEFDTATDVVDGANVKFNIYYAPTDSWNPADWNDAAHSVLADVATGAGGTYAHAFAVTGLTDDVNYTFGVRVEDQSGNEDINTTTLTATPTTIPDTDPPVWDGLTTGIGLATDTTTGGSVTLEFDTATDVVDGANVKFNIYYAPTDSWNPADWNDAAHSVLADVATGAGGTYAYAFAVTGLTDDVNYTFGVRVEDQSGNEDINTTTLTATPTTSVQALIRVNAGGGDYADGSGNLWSADYGYNTGSLDSTDSPIAGTSDDPLYQVGRWDPGASPELEYSFDVTNGDYIVNLHFADIWPGTFGVGLRLFDIQIEGVVVENDLDIYAEVGANTALVKTYNVTVADGQLNIRFLHVKENTKINAIEVISAVTDTDPPVWDGLTTGIGLATDTTTGGSVTLEFDTATDVVDGANVKFNIYYAPTDSWNPADWNDAAHSVLADVATGAGGTYAHAFAVTGLTDDVNYTFGVRVEDQSGNEDINTTTLTATPTTIPDTDPPVWDGLTTGIGLATDTTTGGSVTLEFDTATDVVDGANVKFNIYYAPTDSWNPADWNDAAHSVLADVATGAGGTYAYAFAVTGLTDDVNYTFGVRVEDQSGNEDINTTTLTATPTTSVQALIRVNAGGGDYADGSGNLWSADYGYNTGSLDSTDSPIAGTSDDPLYQVGRWDPGASPELEYSFDVTNGDYIVNLHFADIWPGTFGVGLRLFDIQIEGVVVENDLDIYAEVGANTALVKTYNVTVADGQLNIRFLHVKENTKINAIEVISAVTDTDPPVWDGLTTGIGLATDTTTGGSVTLEFDTATDVVDGANVKFNIYYAPTDSWNPADWNDAAHSVLADVATGAGGTYAHAFAVTGLTDDVNYTFGVRVEDQSGNEDINTTTLTATPTTIPDTDPPVWDGLTTGIGLATDTTTGGSVTLEFDTATDVVDGANVKFNIYYAPTDSWNPADWNDAAHSVLADVATGAGGTYAYAFAVTGLTDDVNYTFGVRVEDQSGNEDINTTTLTATPTTSVQALIRVNAGGGDYADGSGNLWSADYGYNTGSLDSTDSPIAGTSDDPLYQVGRWDPGASPELEYSFDVTNGDYIVNLHFADIWPGTFGVGLRLFDIQIEGVVVENDLDIYAEVGANTALVKTYNVTVADGQLNIRFLHVKENTKINAIEVVSQSSISLPFFDGFGDNNADGWRVVNDSNVTSDWVVSNEVYTQNNNVGSSGTPFEETYHRGTYSFLLNGLQLINYRFSVIVLPQEDESKDIGVLFRYRDNSNYYRLSLSGNFSFVRLEKKFGGTFYPLAVSATGYTLGQQFDITIEVKGENILVDLNGDPLFAVTDNSIASGTVGLYCQGKTGFDDVAIETNQTNPSVTIGLPLAHSVQEPGDVSLFAIAANVPGDGNVEFYIDGSLCDDSLEDPQGIFTSQCLNLLPLSVGEHQIEAALVDTVGELATDTNSNVGVSSHNIVTIGDSIFNGIGDKYKGDNISIDGRIIGTQGVQALLGNLLTNTWLSPVILYNEAIPGDRTFDAAFTRIDSIIKRHPYSKIALILLGTNDSGGTLPVMPGFNCIGTGCDGTFKGNLQTLVDTLLTSPFSSVQQIIVAFIPPVFNSDGTPNVTRNEIVENYNRVIRGLDESDNPDINPLTGHTTGPDFHFFFLGSGENRFSLFIDTLHPNSFGHFIIAYLWHQALTGDPSIPFFISGLTPLNYKQNLLEVGNQYYIDEQFNLTTIPAMLAGGVWIMTSNSDRLNADPVFLSFSVDRDVTVYVAYASSSTLPTWLDPNSSSFIDSGEVITTSNGSYSVYSQDYVGSSLIEFGGNMSSGGTGASNYIIIVKEN